MDVLVVDKENTSNLGGATRPARVDASKDGLEVVQAPPKAPVAAHGCASREQAKYFRAATWVVDPGHYNA